MPKRESAPYGSLRSQGRRYVTHKTPYAIFPSPSKAGEVRDAYLNAEKRLSNEFGGRIGCEPATWPSFGAGAAAAGVGVSEGDGFSGGRAATTCLVSGLKEGLSHMGFS